MLKYYLRKQSKNMKHIAFILIALVLILFIQFSISQNESSQVLIEIFSLKPTYFLGEEINGEAWFGFSNSTPLQNFPLKIELSSGSLRYTLLTYTNESGKATFSFGNLTTGNYQLIVTGNYSGEEIKNSSSFTVEEPKFEIFLEKEKYKANETLTFYIKGPPNKNFVFFISNEILNISFNLSTDENGGCLLNYTFEIPGNYSAKIGENEVNFEILKEEKLIEAELEVEAKEKYYLNENVDILVNGTPETNFSLEILAPTNFTVFSIIASTNSSGKYSTNFKPNQTGNYTIILSFENTSKSKSFLVEKVEVKFEISIPKKEFELFEGVNITIFGSANSSFLLRISSNTHEEIYNLTTNSGGSTSLIFQPTKIGEYEVDVVYENLTVVRSSFSVVEKRLYEISVIDLKQGEAIIGKEVEWELIVNASNFGNSPIVLNLSSFSIPQEAKFLMILDEDNNLISNNSNFSIELPENQSKILRIFYETPAPVKIESKPEIINFTWIKRIFVSSNSSLYYSNVSVDSTVDENLKEIKLFLNGEDITYDLAYEVKFLDVDNNTKIDGVEWKIPRLKEASFEIKGVVAQPNLTFEAQFLIGNTKDVFFDCKNERIEGFGKGYGILIINSENVTILNCFVRGFEIGIFSKDSKNVVLINNTVEENEQGIVFLDSIHNTIINNTATENLYHGVLFYSSSDIFAYGNRIRSNFDIKILEKIRKLKEKI
jgi:parallel beta-helix repeat protein